jgi:ribulose-phosphate 3-epimerase
VTDRPSARPPLAHTPWIAPSILSADFARLGAEVEAVLAAGADLIHFDVMDNHYVPNLTVGPLVCEALRKHGITAPIDVHLMVRPVDRLVADFAKAGATWISFHPEASDHVDRTIALIRDHGCKPGLVLNPATPLAWLDHTLPQLDLVLLMSVNPGFGGQAFIPATLDKIRAVRERIRAGGRDVRLEVDGGIKVDNIGAVAAAGADTFVAGSAIFGSGDYAATVRAMRAAIAAG